MVSRATHNKQELVLLLLLVLLTAALSGCGSSAQEQIASKSSPTLVSLSISPSDPTVALGRSAQFQAMGSFSDGSSKDMTQTVTWSSQQPKVARISSSGMADSEQVGSTAIFAVSGSLRGSTMLTVSPAALLAIAVTPSAPTVPKGATQQLTATGTFTDGSTQNVTNAVSWAATPAGVVTVSGTGLTTAHETGTATITATSGSILGSTTLTVSPAALVAIAVMPSAPVVPKGETQQLVATGTFTDGSTENLTNAVTWAAFPAGVVTVSSTGLTTAKATGAATITATSGSIRGSATLTVSAAALVTIAVTPSAPTIPKGETQQLTATGTFTDGSTQNMTNAVSWAATPAGVVTVSSKGLTTGETMGTASITASYGSIRGKATITVSAPVLVSMAVTPANPSIALGFKQQFKATGTFSDGSRQDVTQTASWSAAQPQIATVSSSGLATTLRVGATAVAAASGSVIGSTTLTITRPVLVSIAIVPSNPSVALGSSEQLRAVGTFSDGNAYDQTYAAMWTSSQPAVATASVGLVSGKEVGTSTIQAHSGSINGSTVLTVTPPVLSAIAVTPAHPGVEAGSSVQLTATGIFTDGSTKDITDSVTWSASPTSVATVNNTALATGQSPGVATIRAVTGSITGTDTMVVSLSSLAIIPAKASLEVGSVMQLEAVGTFANGSTSDVTSSVTWSSAEPTLAAVSNSGLAMGESAGTAKVSASSASVEASAILTVQPMLAVNYFTNANVAGVSSATVNASNPALTGTNLCAMFYVFGPNEVMTECCGCEVSKDDLRTLLINDDLTDNPLTGVEPTSGVIQIVPSDIANNPSCDPTSITPEGAILAWATHLQNVLQDSFDVTETDFRSVPLSGSEQSHLEEQCAAVQRLGSGLGVCRCGTGD